jgi:hypothetical protein
MLDDTPTHLERLKRGGAPSGLAGIMQLKEGEGDSQEAACHAFGYLRGVEDKAEALELRFKGGDSMWFPYHWLGTWQYNRSEGLLLKFSGDVVYLVLIRGTKLDKPLDDGPINLTRAGLARHRVVWLREMTPEETRQVGDSGPTIDSIEVAQFESQAALKAWLKAKAPAFLPAEERAEA